jgi:hypothetical protein
MADPEAAARMAGAGGGFDLSQLPPGHGPLRLLGQLPAAQLDEIGAAVDEQFAVLGDSFTGQMAIAQVRAEYEALGVNLRSLQNRYILRTGGIMLLITLLSVAASITVGLLSARVAAGIVARPAQRRLPQGRELLQRRVRQVSHRLADHPLHQRHHPAADGDDDHHAPGLLRADYGGGRHHPRH